MRQALPDDSFFPEAGMSDLSAEESSLFNRCRHLADVHEREIVLERACGDNAALRTRVRQLLAAYDQEPQFLNQSIAAAPTAPPSPTEITEENIGPYQLLKLIGQGGMGIVYLARQTAPIRRLVAIKIIRPGLDSENLALRFEAERQALAVMDHPCVAKVFDAGVTLAGRPYFVMEYIDGVSITKYCDQVRLTVPQRLQLFLSVCDAVQHAHRKGVIHRDIKPSNILVTVVEGKPVPKVIDFGVAKAINQKLTVETVFTSIGQFVGTLEYMSPEQVRHDQAAIDTRTDVYGLGVLLYELLAGVTPFDGRRLRSVNFDELIRIVSYEEPPGPMRRVAGATDVARIAAARSADPAQLQRQLGRELNWIVMKAIEKDPAKRYSSPQDLADDIQRFLDGRSILARSPGMSIRVWKWIQRHSMASALALVALLGGAAFTTELIYHNFVLTETLSQLRASTYAADVHQSWSALKEHDFTSAVQSIAPYGDNEPFEQYRGLEWYLLNSLMHREGTVLLQLQNVDAAHKPIYGATFSPDQRALAIYGASPLLRIVDPDTGNLLHEWDTGQRELNGITFSPDGKRLWSTGDDGTVREWDIVQHEQRNSFEVFPGEHAFKVLFDPTRNLLVVCGNVAPIRIWDATTGTQLDELNDHTLTVQTLVWLADGRRFLSASDDGVAILWDLEERRAIRRFDPGRGRLLDAAISPDQSLVAVCTTHGYVVLFDLESGKRLVETDFRDPPSSLVFHSDSKRLAVMDRKGNVHLYEFTPRKKKIKPTLLPQSSWATNSSRSYSLSARPDDQMFVTCNANGRVEAWAKPWELPSYDRDLPCEGVRDFQFALDGKSIVAVGNGIRILNLDSDLASHTINPDRIYDYVAFAAGVDRFAAADQERRVTIATVDSSEPPREFDSGLPLLSNASVSLSSDGATLAMAESRGKKVLLVDTATLNLREALEPEVSRMVAFSPLDETSFAYSRKSGCLEVRSLQSTRPVWTIEVPYVDFESLRYSPDGKLLATSSSDRVIRILNAATGKVIHELLRNPRTIDSLAFSPDGRTLASLDDEGALKLWHVASGRLMMDLKTTPSDGRAEMCRFSRDGNWLAYTYGGDAIRLRRLHKPRK